MDSRRPPAHHYPHPPPPPPPPPPPTLPPQTSHPAADPRHPPPPPYMPHPPPHNAPHPTAPSPYAHQPSQYAPTSQHYSQQPPLSLPPIHAPPGPTGPPHDQQPLPPFRHTPQQPHDPREPPEHHPYPQHNRSGHATPAPVSRTYSHDSAHQQRTPTTPVHPGPYAVAGAPDGPPPQPPPTTHHMDHAPQPAPPHGYPATNGVSHGMPPPPQDQQQQQPQSQYMTPVMESHAGYPPPPQSQPMYSQNYGPASANVYAVQRKKQMRATQACEQCRQRKQKCDEGNPCSFCKENSLTCQYRDTPPAKTDKNMERLLAYMETMQSGLDAVMSRFEIFDRRMATLEKPKPQPASTKETYPLRPEEPDREAGLAGVKDHRLAPHKLILLWPSVGPLLEAAKCNVDELYVMEAEERGVLRLHTSGEGDGEDEQDGTQPGGPASPARSEESGDVSAATPPEGRWGTGVPQTPSGEIRRSEPYYTGVGGLKPDGTLDLDASTIYKLHDGYMKHFYRMHPFMDKQRLRKMIDQFVARYSTSVPSVRNKFAVGGLEERPLKRQRSNGSSAIPSHEGGDYAQQPATERSPKNALVWLVLALGKIATTDRLSGPVNAPGKTSVSQGPLADLAGDIKPSLTGHDSTPLTQPTPPGFVGHPSTESRSRRPSHDDLPISAAASRNVDVTAGLAYYAKAAEILGDQGDGNDLVHAQMFLLAGLYKGQLARVKESMSWFNMAGRALHMLLDRYKLFNDSYWSAGGDVSFHVKAQNDRIKDKRHSLVVLAAWSCLQLESDILAELKLPSSGIQDLGEILLLPHGLPEDEYQSYNELGQDRNMGQESAEYRELLIYYTSQLFLRKRLNKAQGDMYSDSCLKSTLKEVQAMLENHGETLDAWRNMLPDNMQWNDDDEPARDILDARLRGKYWGARYVTNRPFLDYALHIWPLVREGRKIEAVARDVRGNPRSEAEIHIFKAISCMSDDEIWRASERCLHAARKSTIAFDGVPGRLVVTNIHGTAHAQFGNMLVMAATLHNEWAHNILHPQEFRQLFDRTINFLEPLAQLSPTCRADRAILQKIRPLLFDQHAPAGPASGGSMSATTASFGPST